jgi:hypothetical protein
MAFSRRVLAKVPEFDVELGPGALGFADESLFSEQLAAAGYGIVPQPKVAVEHHFDEARLEPKSFRQMARKLGRSHAYVAYHWRHGGLWQAIRGLARETACHLFRWLCPMRHSRPDNEPDWRLDLLWRAAFIHQYVRELGGSRKYGRHGLVKLRSGNS